jgi:hypothetical protein
MSNKEAIMNYLNDKMLEGFNGGVKIGFEYGRPSGIGETLKPDESVMLPNGFNLEKEISEAFHGDFFGTLFFAYKNGEVTHFNRIKTIQGKVLDKILGDKAPNAASGKPVRIAVRKP